MNKRDVRHAVDTGFSALAFAPRHKQAVLAATKGEKVMKRKISLGLVLALVLMILAVVAVAAMLLSNKDFTSEVLAPIAQETESNRWTKAELDEILRFADENHVLLTDDIRQRLGKAEGEYKEELMRAFVKAELGFYPATWRIEDQAWYDALLVSAGLSDVQTRFVPEGDEIPQDQALAIAIDWIAREYGDDVDVTDEARYRRYVEYRQFIDQDGTVAPRRWYIEYEALDAALPSYLFTLSTDGRVEETQRLPGFGGADGQPTVDATLDHYMGQYGLHYTWTQETWLALQQELARAVAVHGHSGRLSTLLLQQTFAVPEEDSLPAEAATAAARDALIGKGLVTAAELAEDYQRGALYLQDASGPVWKVRFYNDNPGGDASFTLYFAEVDARTGAVRSIGPYNEPGQNHWYDAYILQSLL